MVALVGPRAPRISTRRGSIGPRCGVGPCPRAEPGCPGCTLPVGRVSTGCRPGSTGVGGSSRDTWGRRSGSGWGVFGGLERSGGAGVLVGGGAAESQRGSDTLGERREEAKGDLRPRRRRSPAPRPSPGRPASSGVPSVEPQHLGVSQDPGVLVGRPAGGCSPQAPARWPVEFEGTWMRCLFDFQRISELCSMPESGSDLRPGAALARINPRNTRCTQRARLSAGAPPPTRDPARGPHGRCHRPGARSLPAGGPHGRRPRG